jgi:radical SAM superfamily enzyme YgiQ (UPF0313 family)
MNICLILHKYGVPLDDPCIYPLGFMYASAYLKNLGHKIKVLNYNLWDYDLKEELKGQDIAGFTGFEEFKPYILRDEKICNDLGVQTVIGGALSTFNAIPEFEGLKIDGEIELFDIENNINKYARPDYEGFGINEYHKRHSLKYMGVLTGRGCPYSCTFCAQTCQFRLRKLDNVFDEIDSYIDKYKLDMIVFNDNTLNINKSRWMSICKRIKIPWCAAIRCQPFDDDMAKAASDSNCSYLVVGVESLNQDKLNRMNKKIKVKQIIRTLDLLNKYKINYHGNILVGFENETKADITNELKIVPLKYSLYPAMVQPFIGTENGKERKITKDEYKEFNDLFILYAKDGGKTCYPQLEL